MKIFTLVALGLLFSLSSLYAKTNICDNYKNCTYRFTPKINFLKYYSSHDLSKVDRHINRLVVVVHGALRNGHEYFNDTVIAAKKHKVLKNTIVLAPHFRKVTDEREGGELYWGRRWYKKWKYGYRSEDTDQLSSFEVIDKLLEKISLSGNFPKLKSIVVTGHSAGGQFTQRYSVATKISKNLDQEVSFVPSNPSSYMFLDEERYHFSGANFEKREIGTSCSEYNHYIYGPIDRASYMANQSIEGLRENFAKNKVIYLMSEEDKGTDSLDRSCEAMLQGKNRFERAKNFFHYIKIHVTSDAHRFVSIPKIGHEHIDVYESKEAKKFVFGIEGPSRSHLDYRKIGNLTDVNKVTKPMFVMFGGGKNEAKGMRTFLEAVRGGDLLVISGKSVLNQRYTHDFWNMAEEFKIPLDSVETISFLNRSAGKEKFILDKIKKAEAIFFTGGDQSKYIDRIKGTLAHQEILKKRVPMAGTSAGLAIMGEYIFSAKKGGLRSRYVLRNPHSSYITIENDFFNSHLLSSLITDTHFSERGREGRLLGFMFKSQFDFDLDKIFGLGVDEQTSLSINSKGNMMAQGKGLVWLYHSFQSKIARQSSGLNFGPIAFTSLVPGKTYPHYSRLDYSKWNKIVVKQGQLKR